MSTILSSEIHSASDSTSDKARFQVPQILSNVAKFIILLAATIGLYNLNPWAAVAFVSLIIAFLAKDFFVFLIHILQSDFDLTKDIFRDLEPF